MSAGNPWGVQKGRQPHQHPWVVKHCYICNDPYYGQYMISEPYHRGGSFPSFPYVKSYVCVCRFCWKQANPGAYLPSDDRE